MRDFNDILDSSEKEGGNYRTLNSMHDFRSFVADSFLLDLGYIGYPFTWRNRREGGFIQERLDRGLATESWINLYPNAQVLHQLLPGSDHSMLLLDTTPMVRKWRKRFIFDPRWGKEERCKEVVHGCWQKHFRGSKGCQVFEKLKHVRMGILRWRKREGCNNMQRVQLLKQELSQDYQANHFNGEQVRWKEQELKKALREEEGYWKLKSRIQWLNDGG